jgi:hypothetical protein
MYIVLGNMINYLAIVLESFDLYEIWGPRWQQYEHTACYLIEDFCDNLNVSFLPYDDPCIDEFTARVLNQRAISPTGVKSILHFGQLYFSKKFQQYDQMSPDKNIEVYG